MRYILVFSFCLVLGLYGFSQDDSVNDTYDTSPLVEKQITETDLEPYKSDRDFDYTETKKEENFMDRALRWFRNALRKFWESIFGVGSADGFLYFVFQILPYLLLALLIYLLIRLFLKVNSNTISGASQAKGQVLYSEEEQIIKNEDIESLISDAIANKNYRLAIRYYYLLSLKKLSLANTIDWQPQKTNTDYIKEITDTHIKFDFENITRIYDYVWYGEFNIDALKFETLKRPFQSLNQTLKHG